MNEDFYKKTLFAARMEREALQKKRDELAEARLEVELRLIQLDRTIDGLVPLCGEEPEPEFEDLNQKVEGLGLADACREILISQDRFMTALRVRNLLEHAGYDLGKHSNALAAIHGILKRFEESGEAESLDVEGKTGYRLKRDKTSATTMPDETPKKRSSPPYSKLVEDAMKERRLEDERDAILKAKKKE